MEASGVVFVTVTDQTTVQPTLTPTTLKTLTSAASSAASKVTSAISSAITSKASSAEPSMSSFTTIASKTKTSSAAAVAPTSTGDAPIIPNNTMAEITLASIILITILFIGIVAFGILLWYRGRCPKCSDLQKRIKALEEGTHPEITVGMVRHRESLRNTRWPNAADMDMKEQEKRDSMVTVNPRGVSPVSIRDASPGPDAQAHRQTALDTLNMERPSHYSLSQSRSEMNREIWPNGRNYDDSSIRGGTPGPESGLGYGNVPPVEASSINSRPTIGAPSEVYLPNTRYIPPVPPLQPRKRENGQEKRAYGDMPAPEGWADVDLGQPSQPSASKWKIENPFAPRR